LATAKAYFWIQHPMLRCLVSLGALGVEPGTTPPGPAQQLTEQEEKLVVDDSGASIKVDNS
jgi:hypothetical protein